MFYKKYLKRILDFQFSLILLLILCPFLILLGFLILIKLGRPVLFRQERPGLNEKLFTIYKFRSMVNEKNKNGTFIPDKLRTTRFGRFLRRSSLDELPELYNVLIGEMSFIGPRPLIPRYLPYYSEIEKKRHTVRPGITGYAQIKGRNSLDWNERFAMDVFYVENLSFIMDIKILIKSIVPVIRRKGIEIDYLPDFDTVRKETEIKNRSD